MLCLLRKGRFCVLQQESLEGHRGGLRKGEGVVRDGKGENELNGFTFSSISLALLAVHTKKQALWYSCLWSSLG